MGITYAEIGIENSFDKRRIDTKAVVDSGCLFLTVPEHTTLQLGFDVTEVVTREIVWVRLLWAA